MVKYERKESMAYRRSTRSSGRGRSSGYRSTAGRSRGRSYSAAPRSRRGSTARGRTRASAGRAQTIRIVVEQPGASAIARPVPAVIGQAMGLVPGVEGRPARRAKL